MRKSKTSVSGASSYQEIGEYWDSNDLDERWDETKPTEFEVDLRSSAAYYPLERELATKLRVMAAQRGISAETLLNLWVQEKTGEEVGAV